MQNIATVFSVPFCPVPFCPDTILSGHHLQVFDNSGILFSIFSIQLCSQGGKGPSIYDVHMEDGIKSGNFLAIHCTSRFKRAMCISCRPHVDVHKWEGVWLMWTLVDRGRGSKIRFFVDVINGWPQSIRCFCFLLLTLDILIHRLIMNAADKDTS